MSRSDTVVGLSETLWKLNKYKTLDKLQELNGGKEIPEDCYTLIEAAFRFGAVFMERAIGNR